MVGTSASSESSHAGAGAPSAASAAASDAAASDAADAAGTAHVCCRCRTCAVSRVGEMQAKSTSFSSTCVGLCVETGVCVGGTGVDLGLQSFQLKANDRDT